MDNLLLKIMKNPLRKTKGYYAYQFMKIIERVRGTTTNNDDFDWRWYHHHYQAELSEIKKVHTQVLSPKDYTFSNGFLTHKSSDLPLHPNHRLLYETILQLDPSSVLEVGCGWGDHLYNLSLLAPNIDLYGRDLSNEQLSFLWRRHPELKADIGQIDITLPFSSLYPCVELCFTQAVIMHIHTDDNHLLALANLFKMASKFVVLMENWKSHHFMNSIQQLFEEKKIPWDNLFFYYRNSPELNKPHIMIVSAQELPYDSLTNYAVLLDA